MARMPTDSNSKPIPALRPSFSEDVTGASTEIGADTTVVRLCSTTGGTYSVTGQTGTTLLPASLVEYIRVNPGDTINTSAATNITWMI